ncbi:MAG: hypothetical protein U0794_22985, partial [Isosphaeraceae bacterium]
NASSPRTTGFPRAPRNAPSADAPPVEADLKSRSFLLSLARWNAVRQVAADREATPPERPD